MNHLGLFEGIGGFSLAARWMGWKTVGWCEWEPFCQEVLRKNFPEVIEENQHGDITKTDFTKYRGTVDILTGGFPCQPYSSAGKRKGTADPRHLWPEMLRAIREVQPRYVVGENVRGLTNWNGGLVFDQVQADLEAEGYEVLPFLLPACGVNAPHRRDRIWFVAHAISDGYGNQLGEGGRKEKKKQRAQQRKERSKIFQQWDGDNFERVEIEWTTTNTNGKHRQRRLYPARPETSERYAGSLNSSFDQRRNWQDFPTVSPVRWEYDGISRWMDGVLNQDYYATISKEYRIKDLQKVREAIQQEEIWQQVRGFWKISEKDVLLKVLQLCEAGIKNEGRIPSTSETSSCRYLRDMPIKIKSSNTSQRRELAKQRSEEPSNPLRELPHEIALESMEIEKEYSSFFSRLNKAAIKSYGNAIVPQVAFQIFKAIEQTDFLN